MGSAGPRRGDCFFPADGTRSPWHAESLALAGCRTYSKDYKAKEPLPERDKLLFLAGGVRLEDPEYSGGAAQLLV
jgi:hypothetical protein